MPGTELNAQGQRPMPRRDLYDDSFWKYVGEDCLKLQRCIACGLFRFPPAPGCPSCLEMLCSWERVSGRGRLISWARFHKQYFPGIPVPHTVVVGETEEGPYLVTDFAQDVVPQIGGALQLSYYWARTEEGRAFRLYRWRSAITLINASEIC